MTEARTRRGTIVAALLLGAALGGAVVANRDAVEGVARAAIDGPARDALERAPAVAHAGLPATAPAPDDGAVGARGRIQPKDGVIRIAGPSNPSVVIARLAVDEGDDVAAGQLVAVLDDHALLRADAERLRIEHELAAREARRHQRLFTDGTIAASEYERVHARAAAAAAARARAEAALDRAVVRAPVAGRVLAVHARAGERVGADGIAELGRVDAMYAVAEVYETDVGRVRVGQRATVTSAAFAGELGGVVERVGMLVGKDDVLDVDPVADADTRVVEVEVRLDDGARVAGLTRLQVEVTIHP